MSMFRQVFRRWAVTLATLQCLSLGLLLGACEKHEAEAPPPPRTVRVVTIHMVNPNAGGSASGVIQARYNAQVGFLVSGRLVSRAVDIGAVVKKGDVLAQIDPTDFKNKLVSAQSQVTAAQSQLAQAVPQEARQAKLLKDGFTTQVNYDQALNNLNAAKASLQSARANLQLAQDQVGYTTLKAESDGAVTATGADPGQVVNAGQMIVQISQLDPIEAVFSVSERAMAVVHPGTSVLVALQSTPDVAVHGPVREVSPIADPVTGTFTVKVSLPDAPPTMRLGAVVTGSVEIKGQSVAEIPTTALLQNGDQPAVWVVSPQEKKVHRQVVKVENFGVNSVAITEGLKEGDIVVTAGINWLAEDELVALPQETAQ
jgi:RND family efflux transporter MFP subunit